MRKLLSSFMLIGLFSCAPALPKSDAVVEISNDATRAEHAATVAEQSMLQAKAQREISEALLKDARDILVRVQVLDNQCKQSVAKLQKLKRPVITKKSEPVVIEKEKVAPPANLDYSPSDAPIDPS